jgi:hypothetical protein
MDVHLNVGTALPKTLNKPPTARLTNHVTSPGVIGRRLKMDNFIPAIPELLPTLGASADDAHRSAVAITTTGAPRGRAQGHDAWGMGEVSACATVEGSRRFLHPPPPAVPPHALLAEPLRPSLCLFPHDYVFFNSFLHGHERTLTHTCTHAPACSRTS